MNALNSSPKLLVMVRTNKPPSATSGVSDLAGRLGLQRPVALLN